MTIVLGKVDSNLLDEVQCDIKFLRRKSVRKAGPEWADRQLFPDR
jgi:hypothetical protein